MTVAQSIFPEAQVVENIGRALARQKQHPTFSIAEMLCVNSTLALWTLSRGGDFIAKLNKERNTSVLADFWALLEKQGICLSNEDKQAVLNDLIND